MGADCLGLVRGVWREVIGPEPYEVPNYSRSWGDVAGREYIVEVGREVMTEIPTRALVPGAMLVFRMLRGATAKHCGILTGAGTFIHAYEHTAVTEERLTQAWRRKIAYAFLFPGAV